MLSTPWKLWHGIFSNLITTMSSCRMKMRSYVHNFWLIVENFLFSSKLCSVTLRLTFNQIRQVSGNITSGDFAVELKSVLAQGYFSVPNDIVEFGEVHKLIVRKGLLLYYLCANINYVFQTPLSQSDRWSFPLYISVVLFCKEALF